MAGNSRKSWASSLPRHAARPGHIITIDVLPEARRAGIGSSLLQAAEDRLRQAGAAIVELETAVDNAAAIQFYKRKEYFVEKTVPATIPTIWTR